MVAAGSATVNAALQHRTISQSDADALNSGIMTTEKVTLTNTNNASSSGPQKPAANDRTLAAQKRALAQQPDDIRHAVSNAEISAMAATLGIQPIA